MIDWMSPGSRTTSCASIRRSIDSTRSPGRRSRCSTANAGHGASSCSSASKPPDTTWAETPLVSVRCSPTCSRNALVDTPDGGHIGLRSWNLGETIVVEVSDSGEGIEEAALSRIFERFEQARYSSTSGGGLGLGLAISRGIVELHGGRIDGAQPGPRTRRPVSRRAGHRRAAARRLAACTRGLGSAAPAPRAEAARSVD